jgi:hypothetical protein
MTTDSITVTINDNLIRFDSLLTALNYLLEEVQTRKDDVLQHVDVDSKVKTHLDSASFKHELINLIRDNYGEGLYQEVAFLVMEKIDNDIAAFINARVDERLRQNGVDVTASTESTSGG